MSQSVELTAKLETAVVAVLDSARKAECVTPAYVRTGKLACAFLTMWTSDDSRKRADGVKVLQARLTDAGLGTNVTRFVKAYAVCSVAPDAEQLPITAVVALSPMVTIGSEGEARAAGRYTAKDVTRLVTLAVEKHWNSKRLAKEVASIRQSNITPEEERNAKIRDRERKAEKLRTILEKVKPETLAAIIGASRKLQTKFAAIMQLEAPLTQVSEAA